MASELWSKLKLKIGILVLAGAAMIGSYKAYQSFVPPQQPPRVEAVEVLKQTGVPLQIKQDVLKLTENELNTFVSLTKQFQNAVKNDDVKAAKEIVNSQETLVKQWQNKGVTGIAPLMASIQDMKIHLSRLGEASEETQAVETITVYKERINSALKPTAFLTDAELRDSTAPKQVVWLNETDYRIVIDKQISTYEAKAQEQATQLFREYIGIMMGDIKIEHPAPGKVTMNGSVSPARWSKSKVNECAKVLDKNGDKIINYSDIVKALEIIWNAETGK